MQSSQLSTLPDGDPAQVIATLRAMRALAIDGAMQPTVRQAAASIVGASGRDMLAFATNIAGWVATHTQFLYDPSFTEALVPPADALARIAADGVAQFDCDDVAILASALGLSVGLRARYVVVSFHTSVAPYEHVWCELSDSVGSIWVPVDPSRPGGGLPPVVRPPLVMEL